jgi:hypothetical protein
VRQQAVVERNALAATCGGALGYVHLHDANTERRASYDSTSFEARARGRWHRHALRLRDRAAAPVESVLGSAAADPALEAGTALRRRTAFEGHGFAYTEVVLGFVEGGSGSRWLSHDEISAGVVNAVVEEGGRHIVGVVDPWSARP